MVMQTTSVTGTVEKPFPWHLRHLSPTMHPLSPLRAMQTLSSIPPTSAVQFASSVIYPSRGYMTLATLSRLTNLKLPSQFLHALLKAQTWELVNLFRLTLSQPKARSIQITPTKLHLNRRARAGFVILTTLVLRTKSTR